MPFPKLFLAVFALCAILQVLSAAQQDPCLHRILPLTVGDFQGIRIEVLRVEDLEAKLQGGPAKILSIAPDNRVHRIVILVDVSGTMGGKIRQVLTPASVLAGTELPNTQMALIVFKDKIEEQIGFSQGQKVIAERLRQMRSGAAIAPGGKTALYDSLLAGLQLLEAPTSADSLYLISDGADNASRAHFDEVAKRMSASGVRLFVSLSVGQFGNRYPTSEEQRGPREMGDLVKMTGGDINIPFGLGFPAKPEEIERSSKAIQRFQDEMIHNYLIEVELPAKLDKATKWEVRLTEGSRLRWKNARLVYPEQLASCNP
jgi:von Willebrand factor type A domain